MKLTRIPTFHSESGDIITEMSRKASSFRERI